MGAEAEAEVEAVEMSWKSNASTSLLSNQNKRKFVTI